MCWMRRSADRALNGIHVCMSGHLGKGLVAGVVGGLVGSVVLRAWMTASTYGHKGTVVPDVNGPAHQVGAMVVEKVTGKPVSRKQQFVAGEVTHYAFGAFTGGIYGSLAEYMPWVTAGNGMLFGTGVFLAADETSMPMLRLVPPPWTEAPSGQLEHWAAHLLYGVVSEWTRRSLRKVL